MYVYGAPVAAGYPYLYGNLYNSRYGSRWGRWGSGAGYGLVHPASYYNPYAYMGAPYW